MRLKEELLCGVLIAAASTAMASDPEDRDISVRTGSCPGESLDETLLELVDTELRTSRLLPRDHARWTLTIVQRCDGSARLEVADDIRVRRTVNVQGGPLWSRRVALMAAELVRTAIQEEVVEEPEAIPPTANEEPEPEPEPETDPSPPESTLETPPSEPASRVELLERGLQRRLRA
ncbi:MAG: hypothetical protein AAGE52_26745 [Myxococcota bacterium]